MWPRLYKPKANKVDISSHCSMTASYNLISPYRCVSAIFNKSCDLLDVFSSAIYSIIPKDKTPIYWGIFGGFVVYNVAYGFESLARNDHCAKIAAPFWPTDEAYLKAGCSAIYTYGEGHTTKSWQCANWIRDRLEADFTINKNRCLNALSPPTITPLPYSEYIWLGAFICVAYKLITYTEEDTTPTSSNAVKEDKISGVTQTLFHSHAELPSVDQRRSMRGFGQY